ncbi:MAG: hydantoinase/oxoprolinase family protein, partial [Euryarchaeota archaeon]|nr:hydantoinase/oxoprolinase family protein [Euryarchaeota archaeon]
MNLGLGVDTGGTYTDSVIMDLQGGKVMCKSKALTTRNDLSIGILESIRGLDESLFKKIRLVSVSSTLATNSVVEGKGCRVGLIIIGHELNVPVPVNEYVEVRGGHNLKGVQRAELDLASAREFVLNVKEKVDAFAVSGYMSVRNPEHEKAVKSMLLALTPLPVVCGHELSTDLGLGERTTTAVLNARLIPIITELLSSVRKVLGSSGIRAPLMIVRGDGSLMGELVARERPVETILSGPAASLIGAKCLTAMEDAVVIDVGGTTTDIGLLRKGKPRLSSAGATVGGWKTRVRAADIATSGIGGDSRVVVYDGRIHLMSLRVVPLCIAASICPILVEKLELAKGKPVRSQLSCSDIADLHQVTEFFVLGKEIKGVTIGADEKILLDLVREEPRSIYEVKEITGLSIHAFDIRKLEELGMIQRIGMTPTDALHANGSYVQYDPSPSVIGVEILSKIARMEPSEFCGEVKRQIIDKITLEVLDKLVYDENGHSRYCEVASSLLRKLAKAEDGGEYSCDLSLRKA